MTQTAHMGMNKTGVQMSPIHSREMKTAADRMELPAGNHQALAQLRGGYIADADGGLGSVPLPGTVTGAVKAGADMLTGGKPQVLIDKLAERLAFERGGTRLYDALLAKGMANGQVETNTLEVLRQFRDEEAAHARLVAEALRRIGADPTAMTPCADLTGVEAAGLMQTLTDPRTTFQQSLHAILVAELADCAGWDLLLTLAERMGHDSLLDPFRQAYEQEQRHLATIRAWYESSVMESASVLS